MAACKHSPSGCGNCVKVKIKLFAPRPPLYATPGAAAMDVYARVRSERALRFNVEKGTTAEEDVWPTVRPMGRLVVPLGFAIALPEGYELQVRPRSGLAARKGVMMHLGTIDSDYRGEVNAVIFNLGDEPLEIRDGDRIAQVLVQRVPEVEWEAVYDPAEWEALSQTKRGTGGFGSTGV